MPPVSKTGTSLPRGVTPFRFREERDLSILFTKALLETAGLSEFMEVVLPALGETFGVTRLSLVDYYEDTGRFVLLNYQGYPADGRHWLQRRMPEMDLSRALKTCEPYHPAINPNLLCIPFYFRDVLEALLVLESDDKLELSPAQEAAARLVSKYLGLLMSSVRLEINRHQLLDKHDLQQARRIQLSFLPSHHPRTEGYEIYGHNRSSAVVGGDYFDYFNSMNGRFQAVLVDACGHGMAAALIVTTFRGLLHSEMGRRSDFRDLFDAINQSVYSGEEFIHYLTGIFLDYDQDKRLLRYLNAGHYQPIVLRGQGETLELAGGGPPLGMFRASKYPFAEVKMNSEDLVVLFTDGLVDIQNPSNEFFGVERLLEALKSHKDLRLPEIVHEVLQEAADFGGTKIEDDVTLMLMRVR